MCCLALISRRHRAFVFSERKNGQILQSRRTRGAFQMQAGSFRLHGKRVESLDNPLNAMMLQSPAADFYDFLDESLKSNLKR